MENSNTDTIIIDAEEHVNEDAIDQTDNNKTAEKVKPKRIRNPQPKFNEDVLRGQRGLTALSRIFKRTQMIGRGHEKKDLSTIMRTYSYWCHRMFPKYPFNACVEKLEKLGTKKRIMAYMQKIRSGLETEADVNESNPNMDEDDNDANDANDDVMNSNNINLPTPQETVLNSEIPLQDTEIVVNEEILNQIRANRERALQIRMNKQRDM